MSRQVRTYGIDHRLEVLGLVVGWAARARPPRMPSMPRCYLPDGEEGHEERRDRRRILGAWDALRARRGGSVPGERVSRRCQDDPPEPGIDRRADASGQGHRPAGHRQDERGEDQGAPRHGRDSVGREAEGQVPGVARRGDPDPRHGRENRKAPVRRDRRRERGGPSQGDRRAEDPRDEGTRPEG